MSDGIGMGPMRPEKMCIYGGGDHQLPVLPSNSGATEDPSGRQSSARLMASMIVFCYASGGRHLRPVPSLLLLTSASLPNSFASVPSLRDEPQYRRKSHAPKVTVFLF